MELYKPFTIAFIISVIALIIFFIVHFQMFFTLIKTSGQMEPQSTAEAFGLIFSPAWTISFIVLVISSITYQVLGIIMIARNPNIDSTDRVLWILGFVMMAFITAIIFMALKKSKNLTTTEYIPKNNPWEQGNFNRQNY